MKKIIAGAITVLILFTLWFYWTYPMGTKVKIRGHIFPVELAVTPQEKERGLSWRKSLAADHGMLFVYDHKGQFDFWMRGMQFPLDFLWISDKKIVDITVNVPPPNANEAPVQLTPKIPVDKILELPAGSVATYGIQPGDDVTFQTN